MKLNSITLFAKRAILLGYLLVTGVQFPAHARIPGDGGAGRLTITHSAYESVYNPLTGQPDVVTYTLTPEMVTTGGVSRSGEEFVTDPGIPGEAVPRSSDYSRNGRGLDRGHMMPAADCKFSAQAMRESFYIGTNVCPQDHTLNEGAWCDLEKQVRFWCRHYYKTGLLVQCGPLFGEKGTGRIGEYGIPVPSGFWKVVLRRDARSGRWTAVGFVFPNDGSVEDYSACAVSVSAVERLTGLELLPGASEEVKSEFRRNDWKF